MTHAGPVDRPLSLVDLGKERPDPLVGLGAVAEARWKFTLEHGSRVERVSASLRHCGTFRGSSSLLRLV